MSNDLISKKDLLVFAGISYGQLYRWKRKNLIPDEWFIRKSTFTGQETFFPKDKIMERIDKIQSMKDNLSLDELADRFSPSVANVQLSEEELLKRNIVSLSVLRFYLDHVGERKDFTFENILNVHILERLLQSGEINLDEGKMLLQILKDHGDKVKQKDTSLLFVRKLGISTCLMVTNAESIQFEKGTKVLVELSINACIEELKSKLV